MGDYTVKVRNLKANHSTAVQHSFDDEAVLATVKVRNLKANHSKMLAMEFNAVAVLATVKVRNLKANHSNPALALGQVRLY